MSSPARTFTDWRARALTISARLVPETESVAVETRNPFTGEITGRTNVYPAPAMQSGMYELARRYFGQLANVRADDIYPDGFGGYVAVVPEAGS